MKKTKRLMISRETVRQLGIQELRGAGGGLSGLRCSLGRTGCGECDDRPSLANTVCDACVFTADAC